MQPQQHAVFVASTNPPVRDLLEKVRKRARESNNVEEEQVLKQHLENHDAEQTNPAGAAPETSHLEEDAEDQCVSVARNTSTSSTVTEQQPWTRRQPEDWTRKHVLEGQAEAKQRKQEIIQNQKSAECEFNKGKSNAGSSNGIGNETPQMRARRIPNAAKQSEINAIARLLSTSRLSERRPGSRYRSPG